MIASAQEFVAQRSLDMDLLAEVAEDVNRVEEELRRQILSRVDLVERVSRLTLEAGGKRLRPAFIALSAKAIGNAFEEERVVKLGASLEMIHMATLIHDDVIDDAKTRRGKPTAAAELGNTAAILSGDVLLAKAMSVLASDADLTVIRVVSTAVETMAEGEVRELQARGDFDLTEAAYEEIVELKTGRFIEACCHVGALIANATPDEVSALSTYGKHVGLAFQIVDDLLDYRGDKAKTGKSTGTDFREGQMTLPMIYLRETLSDAEEKIARHRFGNGASDDEIRMIADWMDTRGAFERAENEARRRVGIAKEALLTLPESHSRQVLEAVADYVLFRKV